MRIGIDARFWGLEHTGIGRYVMALVSHLEKIDSGNDYFIFLREKYFNRLEFSNPRFRKVLADFPHYSLKEQIAFRRVLLRQKLDLVHFPHFNLPVFYPGRFVVTIHDLIKHESRGPLTTTRFKAFYYFKYLGYLLVLNLALRRAKKVIVPSFWWKRKLIKKFGLEADKIGVTYESVSEAFFRKNDLKIGKKILTKYGIQTPFVIYTGNLYPHKNVLTLVKAIKKINRERRLFLVIVCAKSVFWQRFQKEISQLGAGDLVILAGFVSDAELTNLYRLAEAFVFPTLLEGFGLPGLESMAAGLPVVCSRSSCLPEIYQKAALYFNPKKAIDIKEKIELLLENKYLRKELIRKGKSRVKGFSWERMARETIEIYQQAIEV
ncbi:MAG: glycosyltransferase family 4 protein [Candidatus Pacebacteria bacterium]|nr:glycosyltransferase family 4 protein [Candidatus Paceibacterota bacterium]